MNETMPVRSKYRTYSSTGDDLPQLEETVRLPLAVVDGEVGAAVGLSRHITSAVRTR